MFDEILARAATRRRRAEMKRVIDGHPAAADVALFDEFGAPEGGFGRLDPLMTELRRTPAESAVPG